MLGGRHITGRDIFRCPAQDIQDSVLTGQTRFQGQFTSHIDGVLAVLRNRRQDTRKLPVAALRLFKGVTKRLQTRGKAPFTERQTIAQGSGFASPKTCGHSPKLKFVVMMSETCSYSLDIA